MPGPFGDRLLTLFAWLELPPSDQLGERLIVRIDPGSTFGTGSHPPTPALPSGTGAAGATAALQTLAAAAAFSVSLLYGLGPDQVVACDVDPLAV